MIKLTKINGEEIVINAELIETVEARPDTTISLATGNKIIVKDTVSEVVEKVLQYRRLINQKSTKKKNKVQEKKDKPQ
ncbi:MAG: flagellar FlbD family protein [Elusimicrobiota bacterium]|nr:flagellar FlbD family protein [Elusimicrobiota bacterium]MDH5661849.1 flagellar FlbD family protein [Elusimicrobiota bacterium]